MSFSELSIKKLNKIIRAKATQLSSDKAKVLLQQRELQYEKAGLIALCNEYIDPAEIEKLLSATSTAETNSPSSSSSSAGAGSVGGDPMGMANMTPDQMRQQAQAMRQNPSAFRFMQTPPLTDEQILQAAAQMEQLASNPAMLQQMKDQMAKMSPEDIEKLRKQQQQGQGRASSSSTGTGTGTGTPPDSTDLQIDNLMRMLTADPAQARAFIKSQPGFGGLSDEVIDQQLDYFRKMDPVMLKTALGYVKPLTNYYQQLDAKTGGRGKYVLIGAFLLLVLLILYLMYLSWGVFWMCWGYIFGTTAASTPSDMFSETTTAATARGGGGDGFPEGGVMSAGVGSAEEVKASASLSGHYDDNDEFEF